MKAFVDHDTCIGCELCAMDHPEIFSMNDEGTADAITEELTDDQVAEAEDAVENCPSESISVK